MLLWAPRCTHGADLSHIWSEITSRKQDDFAGVSRQSRLRRRVCQHFPFASAAVQKDTKIESGHVCQVIVVSIHYFFLSLHRPRCHFPQWPSSLCEVLSSGLLGWTALTLRHRSRKVFSHGWHLWHDTSRMRSGGINNSVAPFRCDSESFKGSVCHIWDFEEETV